MKNKNYFKRSEKDSTKNVVLKYFLMVFLFLVLLAVVLFYLKFHEPSIKSSNQLVLGTSSTPKELRIDKGKKNLSYMSPVFRSEFQFNSIAPHWKEKHVEKGSRAVEIRVSSDRKKWTNWMEIEPVGPLRDDDPYPERTFSESPLFIEGKFFQYKIELSRTNTNDFSPEIRDLKINYVNSKTTKIQKQIMGLKAMVFPAANAEGSIDVISRAGWGNPDPYGTKLKGTNKYWRPSYSPTKQVFLHHTVNSNFDDDPEATLRAIWDYHANTRGWGDIGYNYIVDNQGRVYEGRFGGDNVVAGHTYKYNKGSLGVAVIGCFEETSSACNQLNNGNTTAPSNKVLNSLSSLLSWKTTGFEIAPNKKQTFCNTNNKGCLNLWTISAHKDANPSTSCNGNLFYEKLSQIRSDTETKNTEGWTYLAKQLSYNTVNVGSNNTPVLVTLSFKNTGTSTWSNSTNKLFIKTANPNNRTSKFMNEEWINDSTPAILNEANVAPDETGTFTFKINHPPGFAGYYFEGLRLVTENNEKFKNIFNLSIKTAIPRAVYRLYSPSVKRHFYTMNPKEKDYAIRHLGFHYEGVGFQSCGTSGPSVYRLYHQGIKKHFFTMSAVERDKVVEELGYVYEGVAWYSCEGSSPPVYRLYNHYARNHFYTKSAAERDHIVNNLNFDYEGVGFRSK